MFLYMRRTFRSGAIRSPTVPPLGYRDIAPFRYSSPVEIGRPVWALEAFDTAITPILRDGMQLGWFPEDEHEWESFRDRLGSVRALCLEKLG